MSDTELAQVFPSKLKQRFLLCYLGIMLSLGISGFSLASIYGYVDKSRLPWMQNAQSDNLASETKDPAQVNKSNIDISTADEFKIIQALNLLYSAEFSFNILHNKAQTIEILQLVKSLLPAELAAEIDSLAAKVDKYVGIDKNKLISMLDDLNSFYLQQVQKGKFGQKTIAQIVRIEDQDFIKKSTNFLDNIQALQISIEADNLSGLSARINNIVVAANNIAPDLATKAQMLSEFNVENTVSFDELLSAVHDQLGRK